MIKAIVFDFAGVIGSEGYWGLIKELYPNDKPYQGYFQELSDQLDVGKITHQQFEETLSQKINVPQKELWPKISKLIKLNFQVMELALILKQSYQLGILTNYTYPWFEKLTSKFNLEDYFDPIIISSRVHLKKPDPKIYQLTLNLMQVEPAESLFIDDRLGNVEAARKLGMGSLHFISTEKLKEDMRELGITT